MTQDNEKEFWTSVEKALCYLLEKCQAKLDVESYDAVKHYLDHSEFEMAFEGLFIELIKQGYFPADMSIGDYHKLAINLDLNKESVFDSDFWRKFSEFVCKY